MEDRHSRTAILLGESAPKKLKQAHVAVLGLGGVGSYLVEALARAGVGKLTLIDRDVYTKSNLNRQLYALPETVGRKKTEVACERVLAIDPSITVTEVDAFVLPENIAALPLADANYIADAIDTVSAKIELAVFAKAHNIPLISAMGAGNKTDPAAFRVARLKDTRVCPLARVMRSELRARGIQDLKVVYSEEIPQKSPLVDEESGKAIPGSVSFVPSVMGLIMAGEIIKDIVNK